MLARSRLRLPVVALSLVLAATFGPPSTSASAGSAGEKPKPRDPVMTLLEKMTVREKVGQLFVIEVAGQDANDVSDTAMETNQRLYGVDTPAQVIAKYRPGGVIYF